MYYIFFHLHKNDKYKKKLLWTDTSYIYILVLQTKKIKLNKFKFNTKQK